MLAGKNAISYQGDNAPGGCLGMPTQVNLVIKGADHDLRELIAVNIAYCR